MTVFKVMNYGNAPVKIRDGRGFAFPSRVVEPGIPAYFLHRVRGDHQTKVEEVEDSGIESKLEKEITAHNEAYRLAAEYKRVGKANYRDGAPIEDMANLVKDAMFRKGLEGGAELPKQELFVNVRDAAKNDPAAQAYLDRLEEKASILDDPE